jgi:sugar lactone lactonase YvrE
VVTPVPLEVDVALAAGATLGEGPVWDAETATLVWVDILGERVHRLDPATGRDTAIDVGRPVGAAGLRRDGGVVLAVEDGFALVDAASEEVELVAAVGADDPAMRFNDGACDPAGGFLAGTMAYDLTEGAASLYRLDADLTVTEVVRDVTISNGLGWSPDRRTMYYIDSPTHRIDAFDYDTGTGRLSGRRTVVETPAGAELPDGLTVDEDGCLWVAFWDGWVVRRYTPSGTLDREVELPVARVTSCAFGGADLATLYITSARDGLDEAALAEQPLAGAVFACEPGVRGLPEHRFDG